uniref:Uncharacterized protein n=1 Tax=Nelumbo nucifera TaxID=4432 RepID=A0A822YQ48_NELNU|nr:TPA_asm: hypothetical protein HUJ06_005286 [Nelumbo nucifera]
MRKQHVEQANVNVRLSVNVVWSVQSDGLCGHEPIRADTNRCGTRTEGPHFFDFVSLGVLLPPNPTLSPSAATEFRQLIDGDYETSSGNVFFSLLLLLFFSSSSPMVGGNAQPFNSSLLLLLFCLILSLVFLF